MKNKFRFRLGQELRNNLPDEDGCRWGRAKRANEVQMVVTDWDHRDRHYVRDKKSWKRKRDKQYHVDGRPQKHSVTLPGSFWHTWTLGEYFNQHKIPYRIIPRREKRTSVYWIREEYKPWYNVPVYHYGYNAEGQYVRQHQMGFRTEYHYVPLDKPIRKERNYWETVDYKVVWWSKHDIDIEKILASMP